MKGSVMFVTKIVKIGPALYRVRAYIDGKFSRHWTQTIKGNLQDAKQLARENVAHFACLSDPIILSADRFSRVDIKKQYEKIERKTN